MTTPSKVLEGGLDALVIVDFLLSLSSCVIGQAHRGAQDWSVKSHINPIAQMRKIMHTQMKPAKTDG